MSNAPRLLTMKPYEWEAVERTIDDHSALEPSYVDALHSEVLAQAARVQALEQELHKAMDLLRDADDLSGSLSKKVKALEQERERIRQALAEKEQEEKAFTSRRAKRLYHELLYEVQTKYPNESRHETALRYIRQAESLPPAGEREET